MKALTALRSAILASAIIGAALAAPGQTSTAPAERSVSSAANLTPGSSGSSSRTNTSTGGGASGSSGGSSRSGGSRSTSGGSSGSSGGSSSRSSSSSTSLTGNAGIGTKTVNGNMVITFQGREFPVGQTQGQVSTKSKSVNGTTYAAAFDGDRVIWENVPGAAQQLK